MDKYTETLIENAAEFLDVATHRKIQSPAKVFTESEQQTSQRLDEAATLLDRMFGKHLANTKSQKIDEAVDSVLNVFKQDKQDCCQCDLMYHGKAHTGVEYFIHKKSPTDFVTSFIRPNGGKADLATYTNFNAALLMLQSQVPSLSELHNAESLNIGATKDDATPTDYASMDDLHESIKVGDTVETIKQGQQRGKVEKVETKNGITKVYHRHENGNLYASAPSNLRVINEAYGDAKYGLGPMTPQHKVEKYHAVKNQQQKIEDLKKKLASVNDPEEYDSLHNQHKLAVAELANIQTYMKGGIVEAVDHILEQLNVSDISQLSESKTEELFTIATEVAQFI